MSAAPAQLNFQKACADDADALVALRIEAMSESLERIGRFNLARARTPRHAPASVFWTALRLCTRSTSP